MRKSWASLVINARNGSLQLLADQAQSYMLLTVENTLGTMRFSRRLWVAGRGEVFGNRETRLAREVSVGVRAELFKREVTVTLVIAN